MEQTGKVIAVLPLQSGTSSNGTWSRQTVVIEYIDGQYPVQLALENAKNAAEFGKLKVGTVIKAKFSPSSREYNGKWYTTLRCFAWDVVTPAPSDDLPC